MEIDRGGASVVNYLTPQEVEAIRATGETSHLMNARYTDDGATIEHITTQSIAGRINQKSLEAIAKRLGFEVTEKVK